MADISKINIENSTYDLKDATARADINALIAVLGNDVEIATDEDINDMFSDN